jgi:hypothetical protein
MTVVSIGCVSCIAYNKENPCPEPVKPCACYVHRNKYGKNSRFKAISEHIQLYNSNARIGDTEIS